MSGKYNIGFVDLYIELEDSFMVGNDFFKLSIFKCKGRFRKIAIEIKPEVKSIGEIFRRWSKRYRLIL